MTTDAITIPRWPLERWLLVGTFVVSLLGFTFGLGVNWSRITAVEAGQAAAEKIYLRADVYQADQQGLKASIDRLSRALERLEQQQAAQRQADPPQTRGRMFDR